MFKNYFKITKTSFLFSVIVFFLFPISTHTTIGCTRFLGYCTGKFAGFFILKDMFYLIFETFSSIILHPVVALSDFKWSFVLPIALLFINMVFILVVFIPAFVFVHVIIALIRFIKIQS